ncbi:MAG: hypothetical protein GXO30_00785 [Epsilonproteobacteria bacterium]|nr:hypothetical protein [Campylobacterota bacterium]
MKTLTKSVVALAILGTLTLGVANEVTNTIDSQIGAIQNAPTQEKKIALVNNFKQNMSSLSAEDKAYALNKFQSSMQANTVQMHSQAKTQAQTKNMFHSMGSQKMKTPTSMTSTHSMGQNMMNQTHTQAQAVTPTSLPVNTNTNINTGRFGR